MTEQTSRLSWIAGGAARPQLSLNRTWGQEVFTGWKIRWLKEPRGAEQRRPPLHFVSSPSPVVRTGRTVSSFPAAVTACDCRRPSQETAALTLLFLIKRGRRPPSGISTRTVTTLLGWRETRLAGDQGELVHFSSWLCSNSSHAFPSRLSYLFIYIRIHVFIYFLRWCVFLTDACGRSAESLSSRTWLVVSLCAKRKGKPYKTAPYLEN